MDNILTEQALMYIHTHVEENIKLLSELGRIPAPSHQEDQRAAFIKSWLEAQGAEGVYVDEAKNVIYPLDCDVHEDLVVIMAHMDIVFPDLEPLCLEVRDGKMYAPGIGDDTGNLVQLLMTVKYIIENKKKPDVGILFVANACEEGLGNLKGSKAIIDTWGSRVKEFISFDGYTGYVTNDAVGSHRYQVTVKTEGGHSFGNFGNSNAIVSLASMIGTLYEKKVPTAAKTTYNVGTIIGGTTVNSIAQEASMLYEFRSVSRACLNEMEQFFHSVIDMYRHMDLNIAVEVMGIRPCAGEVDQEKLAALTQRNREITEKITGRPCEIGANSTDSNIPLSVGIVANTVGAIRGGKAHTREEWVDLSGVEEGFKIAMAVILQYFSA